VTPDFITTAPPELTCCECDIGVLVTVTSHAAYRKAVEVVGFVRYDDEDTHEEKLCKGKEGAICAQIRQGRNLLVCGDEHNRNLRTDSLIEVR